MFVHHAFEVPIMDPVWASRTRFSRCTRPSSSGCLFSLLLLVSCAPLISLLLSLFLRLFFFCWPIVLCFSLLKMTLCDDAQCTAKKAYCIPSSRMTAAAAHEVKKAATGDYAKSKSKTPATGESPTSYLLQVPAPGVRASDVQCSLDHANVVRITGKSPTSGGSVATVDTALRLPSSANVETIKVSVAEGLVSITVDKKQPRTLRVASRHPPPAAAPAPASPAADERSIPIDDDEPRAAPIEVKAAESQSDSEEEEDEAGFVAVSGEASRVDC